MSTVPLRSSMASGPPSYETIAHPPLAVAHSTAVQHPPRQRHSRPSAAPAVFRSTAAGDPRSWCRSVEHLPSASTSAAKPRTTSLFVPPASPTSFSANASPLGFARLAVQTAGGPSSSGASSSFAAHPPPSQLLLPPQARPLLPATISPVPFRTSSGNYFVPNVPPVIVPPRQMMPLQQQQSTQRTDDSDSDDDSSEMNCSQCCESSTLKSTIRAIFLGQAMSLCLCGTGVGSELLAKGGFNAPAAQNFLNYFLLFFVYGLIVGCRSGDRNLLNVLRRRGWKYLLLAFVDVQANYLIVYAYQYTNLTSIQILDCSTIPVVMTLSWLFLAVRYLLSHLIGVSVCLVGIGLIIYADAISGRGTEGGENRVLGDVLCLCAALLYGVANVSEEFLVKQYDRIEYLGVIGLFGCIIAGIQASIFEHSNLLTFQWSLAAAAEYALYTGCMFAFYSMVSVVMQQTSALMFNLAVLTADFYSLLAGIFIFSYAFNILYFLSFLIVLTGSVVYSARKTKERSRAEGTWASKILCFCCPCANCWDCRPRANYTVRDAQRTPSISEMGSPPSSSASTPVRRLTATAEMPPLTPLRVFVRGVRSRGTRSDKRPAPFVEEATTFADKHTVINDPFTRLPYPPEQLVDHLNSTAHERQAARQAKFGTRKQQNDVNFDHIDIEKQIFLMFPGQGSQVVGMGAALRDHEPSRRLFEQASEFLGYDLQKLCLEGPKSKLDQTIFCQPALFLSTMAAVEKLRAETEDFDERLTNVAGFSVGELAALVVGGVLSFEDALRVVAVRAQAMHDCNQLVSSGMLTIKTKADSRLHEAMKEAREKAAEKGEAPLCDISNFLYCGTVVVGGSQFCLRFLKENSERCKFQVVRELAVSGAFHTGLMQPAEKPVLDALRQVDVRPPTLNVYSNYLGKVYSRKKTEIRRAIVKQLSNPVKWEQIMQLIYRKHQDYRFPTFYEVGPGRQLGAILMQVSKKAYLTYKSYFGESR
ncbi:PKS-AT domain-containing protein [Aphelenchoides fujianensis]|nr:PKS-AT domain-containing protein [Aphelenchoides fujianensis]